MNTETGWSDVAASQGLSAELENARTNSLELLEGSRGDFGLVILTLDFWPPGL